MPETPPAPAEGEEIAPEDEARISKVVKKLLGQSPPAPTPAPAPAPTPAPHAPSSGGGDVTAQVTAALQQHEERNKTATRITDLEKQVADMKNAKPKRRSFFSPLFGD